MMTTPTKTKKCESCGKSFSCASESGNCWCFELKLDFETLENLRNNYQNCLCEDCLKKVENNDLKITKNTL